MIARSLPLLMLLAAFFLFFGRSVVTFYTDYLWFQEVGQAAVFRTTLLAKIIMFAAGAVIVFLLLWVNIRIARRAGARLPWVEGNYLEIPERHQLAPIVNSLLPLGLGVAAFLAGSLSAMLWEDALRFLHPTQFGRQDPLFGQDIGFYVFRLPIIKALYSVLLGALALSVVVTAALYVFDEKVAVNGRGVVADPRVKPHLLALLGLLLLVRGAGYRLNMYDLLHSGRGAAYGASYTDVNIVLPVLQVTMVAALVSGLFVIVSGHRRGWKLPAAVVGAWLVISMIGGQVVPSTIQRLQVTPNELTLEQPYITHNINFTRSAYNLDSVEEQEFAAEEGLSNEALSRNPLTVENIRLWDDGPLLTSYQQLQEIRTYYDFVNVDIDRYMIDGRYRQVMLSAREISPERLPSKLWINERLTYTHGYGIVVSPVNRITGSGLPDFMLKNIPPTGHADLKVDRPEIYFGELSSDYVFVKTNAREFDYPAGETNVYATYEGDGGVPVGGYWRRLAFAYRFQSLPVLLNKDITPESRVLFHRRPLERLSRIAPFLSFDRDPYMVVSEGRLFWICDAYTRTNMYPYSQPVRGMGNYIRNSVKAVIDAYHGTVTFYIADPTDPLIRTYSRIFPGLFQPLEQMDPNLQRHIRYPQTLFDIQARLYAVYHMTDPQVFYNKEDVWEIPAGAVSEPRSRTAFRPVVGPGGPEPPTDATPRGRGMEPYYTIMKLPGETREEFIQLIPFTPAAKDNLRAWMCARNDRPNYGQLVVYNFPKAKLVYGPSQINARIEQDAQISQQLTLWRQSGSDIIRGNLVIIPIEQSLLYVQPLYLQAARGEIPELKRVLVAYGEEIAMEVNLERSLATLFGHGRAAPAVAARPAGAPSQPTAAPRPTTPGATVSQRELARDALQRLRSAREGYRRDDWARFGEEMKRLEQALQRLAEAE